jgi:Spy/CpxP family protein refolding chaperone
VMFCASTARAQLPDSEHKKMDKEFEEKFNAVIKELNLTAEQQEAITKQRSEDKANFEAMRKKNHELREAIRKELDGENTDMDKLSQLVSQTKELASQRIDGQIKGVLAMKKILTPEQFKLLSSKIKPPEGRRHGPKGGDEP